MHYEIGDKKYVHTSTGMYETIYECVDCGYRFNYSMDRAESENEKRAEHVCIISVEEDGK